MNQKLLAALVVVLFVVLATLVVRGGNSVKVANLTSDATHLQMAGKLSKAKRLYRQALRINPNAAEAQFGLGSTLMRQRRGNEAAEHLEKAVELAPGNAQYHAWLAFNYYNLLNRRDEARRHMAQAVKLQPNDTQYRLALATFLRRMGETTAAISEYERVVKLDPSLIVAHKRLGELYRRLGRTADAKRELNAVARLTRQLRAAKKAGSTGARSTDAVPY